MNDKPILSLMKTLSEYKQYLKKNGVKFEESGTNPNVMSFFEFQRTNYNEADELNKELERVNEIWLNHILAGHDDTDICSDAFHCKMNARRIVRRLEALNA